MLLSRKGQNGRPVASDVGDKLGVRLKRRVTLVQTAAVKGWRVLAVMTYTRAGRVAAGDAALRADAVFILDLIC